MPARSAAITATKKAWMNGAGSTCICNVQPAPFIQAFFVAVIAALLAGIYPAYRMGKMATVDALRFE